MEPPSGTVTFLFTDLRGSTHLWERDAEGMRVALERHEALVRAHVEAHDGTVVKSTGDGFMIAFGAATQAIAAAIEVQRAVGAEPWTVPIAIRMGLHTGTAHPVAGDYHAPAVNRAARVAGAAHGGQILVSSATAGLAEGFELRDLGEHRLKGLPVIRLLQVVAPGLRYEFPELSTSTSGSVHVPSPLTSFVGRNADIEDICRRVHTNIIVTLIGVGGCGKTRLAIEAANRLASDFTDGVRFVDLAPVTDDLRLLDAVGSALGLDDEPGTDQLARLTAYMSTRHVLVVLDNCEHLLDASATFAEAVAARTETSRILATSREPLAVEGEQVLSVRSLEVETDAVELFIDRASHVREAFDVDDAGRSAVQEICRRLDGIPLAIELAAAQVAHLSVVELLARLNDRFELLVGGRRRVQRQQTLAATLDWSHAMLSEGEQAVFRRLAVFPSGFTLDAAQAVVGGDDVIRDLASLVAKSLVDVRDDGERFRYHLLETVRMYAEAHLVSADEATRYRTRHRDWVIDWLESIPLEIRWFGDTDVLQSEAANIRAALEWSNAVGPDAAIARVAAGLDWTRGEALGEGIRWCERAAAVADSLPGELRMQLFTALTVFWTTSVNARGAEWAERAMALGERQESDELLAVALAWHSANLSVRAATANDAALADEARATAGRAVATSDRCTPPWQMYCRFVAGMAHGSLATSDLGNLEPAEAHFREAAARAPIGPPYTALRAILYEYLSLFRLLAGDAHKALAIAEQAPSGEGRWPMFGPNRSAARLLALAAVGDTDAARIELRLLDEAFRRADVESGPEIVCMYGGALAALAGDWERAALLLAAGRRGVSAGAEGGLTYFHFRDLTRAALGQDAARRLRAAGMAMPVDDAVALAFR